MIWILHLLPYGLIVQPKYLANFEDGMGSWSKTVTMENDLPHQLLDKLETDAQG